MIGWYTNAMGTQNWNKNFKGNVEDEVVSLEGYIGKSRWKKRR